MRVFDSGLLGVPLTAVLAALAALVVVSCGSAPEEIATPEAAPTAIAGASATVDQTPVWVDTSPRLALPGQTVAVTAQGFGPAEPVEVLVHDSGGETIAGPLRARTNLLGGLTSTTTITLPTAVVSGTYGVSVKGDSSGRQGSAPLWVRSALPTITLSRDALHPQEPLTIDGQGFIPNERVVIYFAGQGNDPLTAVSADQDGNLRADGVPIPALNPGDRQIVATGAISMAQVSRAFRLLPFEPAVAISADAFPPGAAAGFFGSGFAAGDDIVVNLEGSTELPITISADGAGRLMAPQAFTIPDVKGQQTFALDARQTGKKLRVTFQAVPGYPVVELSGYSVAAGDQVGLAVRGLRPGERLDAYLAPPTGARKKLATFRADGNGWLLADSRVTIPVDTPPGLTTLALDGEAARPPIRLRLAVLAR